MVDISKKIRMCAETGKVKFGERDAVKASLLGSAKLIILSSNCRPEAKSDILHNAKISGIPTIIYEGNGYELGSACGVPYVVSAMSVFDAGNSDLVPKEKKTEKE